MSSINGSLAKYDALRSMDFESMSENYTPIGTVLTHAARIIVITNTTNTPLYISYDGVTDHSYIPSGYPPRQINYGTNRGGIITALEQQAQTSVFVKYVGSAPTSGSIFVEIIYAE